MNYCTKSRVEYNTSTFEKIFHEPEAILKVCLFKRAYYINNDLKIDF